MPVCSSCGKKISELAGYRCLGFACDRWLCESCRHGKYFGGYCPRCKILREIEGERMKYGGRETDDLYDDLDEVRMYEDEEQ
jgi:hypothetical protein